MKSIKSRFKGEKIILQSKIESNYFHCAMQLPLQICQFFGFFPIYVGSSNPKSLEVKWLHWRMFYSIITIILFIIVTIGKLSIELPKKQCILTIDGMIFATSSVVYAVLFLKLTTEWQSYVKEWCMIESKMIINEKSRNLKKQLNIIAVTVMTVATVEHYLISSYLLKTSMDYASNVSEGAERYFNISYGSSLTYVGYSFWKGLILEFINVQMAFIWTYADVIIMLIGSALKFRLCQITVRVKDLNKIQTQNIQLWRELRKDYQRIAALCDSTNDKISSLILVTFLVNLYFILKQIFRSLNKLKDAIERAYFYISFILMVLRISLVIIFGSGIHDEWKDICLFLQSVQTSAYNLEVERFITNVTTYELVLSGKNFFSIRRSLILKIAGTVVTYELIIIQFYAEMLKNSE